MNWVVFAVVAWLTLGVEVGLRDALAVGQSGVAPSFVVVLLVFVASRAPRGTAVWASLTLGLLLDLTRAPLGPGRAEVVVAIGPYALGCAFAGYAVVTMRALMMRRNPLATAFLAVVASGIMHVVVVALVVAQHIVEAVYTGQPAGALIGAYAPGSQLGVRALMSLYTGVAALPVGAALMVLTPLFGFAPGHARPRIRRH